MSAPKDQTQKKGEVNELLTLLRGVNSSKESPAVLNKKKRETLKKVIAYMTLGIDVSRLFPDMIMACNTKDLVVKKMVYLYLSNYAASNAELTLLVINTLQKDCRDEDPMIRGLALRCFTSLRLRSILEYIVVPLKAALTDTSGYVRSTGVMGCLKVWHLSPETIKDSDIVDTLYSMIRDREPQVVVNCLSALNEILAEEGGIAVNQALIVYLLNRIREFTEWGQCSVLALCAKYAPADEEEMFNIMNLLDGCLKVAHSGVVLATVRAFLHLTRGNGDLQRQVFLRLKTPLLTLMASSSNEVSFSVLGHVALVVERAPGVFDDEYKQFFCKFTEPSAVKGYKLGILPRVASAANAREVVAELTEYVSGVDAELARLAVRAIGEIALRVPEAAEGVVESLLELIEMDAEYVRGETIMVMQEMLRVYPERAPTVVPSLHRCLRRMEGEESGRAAVVWMLGEYGQLIDDAPYLLEPLIDGITEEPSVQVKCELLTAAIKLFFKRPPELHAMLGRLFKSCLADGVDALLHDRALLYYRLLRANAGEANAVIAGSHVVVKEFDDEVAPEVRDTIFSEFNTLSVLYKKPSASFIAADHLIAAVALPVPAPANLGQDDDRLLVGEYDDGGGEGGEGGPRASQQPQQQQQQQQRASEVDFLGDDLLGLGLGGGAAAASSPPPQASLLPTAWMDAPTFQSKWGGLPVATTWSLRATRLPGTPSEVEGWAKAVGIFTIASGDTGAAIKWFLFAQDTSKLFVLMEGLLDKQTGAFNVTVKSDPGASINAASTAFKQAVAPIAS